MPNDPRHEMRKLSLNIMMSFWFCIFFMLAWQRHAISAERLDLRFSVSLQFHDMDAEGSIWRTMLQRDVDGIAGIQYFLDEKWDYRIVIEVDKPFDLAGSLKVRTPIRDDGVVMGRGKLKGKLILGPHKGCDKGHRCDPLSPDEVGQFQVYVNMEKAVKTSYGAFLLRPFLRPGYIKVRPSIFHDDRPIECGSEVKKGWWIFAKKLRVEAAPTDTVSLCVQVPSKEVFCATDETTQIKIRTNAFGTYQFFTWNNKIIQSQCSVLSKR